MRSALAVRAKGSRVPANVMSPSIVYAGRTAQGGFTNYGGGYGWGGGPRAFVGPTSRPATVVEAGRPGDFPEGAHVWGPSEGDPGFPSGTRWPGWPGGWQAPFFAATPGGPIGPSMMSTAGYPSGWHNRFLGGALLEGRVSTVFACVDLISRALASMPILTTKDSSPVDNPAWTENPEPTVYVSIVDGMKAVLNSLLIRGAAYIVATARYADGTVARWVVLNPDMVRVESDTFGMPTYYVEGVGEVPSSEILNIRYQVWPGIPTGVGPLEAAWRNVVGADALERWGTELAIGNGIPTAILQSQTKLTKPQAQDLKTSWAEAALTRGTLPVILSGGLTYTPLNLKPAEVGLLDLRTFDETRIAAAFGIQPWLVGLPMQSGLTYATVAGTFDYTWRATLQPLSNNVMQALSGFCLQRGLVVRQDAESFTRPPLPERATAYKALIESGVIDPNEARIRENLAPREDLAAEQVLAEQTNGVT